MDKYKINIIYAGRYYWLGFHFLTLYAAYSIYKCINNTQADTYAMNKKLYVMDIRLQSFSEFN